MKGYSVKEISQTNSVRKSIFKNNIFKQKEVASSTLLFLLIGMVLIYAFLLGLFLTGFITSLTCSELFYKSTSFNASYKCDLNFNRCSTSCNRKFITH